MKSAKKFASIGAVSALLIGGAVVIPRAVASETSSMSVTCTANDIPILGSTDFSAGDVKINVDAPTKVKVGDEFEATFSIDPVTADLSGCR